MKKIPPSTLLNFHGLSKEDPHISLFDFDVLCLSYDYTMNAQKLKLFPTTLKDSTLCWLMGLGENSIQYWDDMKMKFLNM